MRPEEKFNKLKARASKYLPKKSIALIEKAFDLSLKAHQGQFRKSGLPFITHPIEVGLILADLKQDENTIAACLLHDTLEDTQITVEQLKKEFSEELANLVVGVTKLGKIYFGSSVEVQAENYRRLFLATAEDLRVVLIKLADRLHNMRTLKYLAPEKQKVIAKETLDIFAPLANRLGMGSIRWELEDLAFMYLEPKAFQEVKSKVALKRNEREKYIHKFVKLIYDELKAAGVEVKIIGRPKHFYSIYKKLTATTLTFEEIYDLLGIRIVTKSINACYEALGLIHSKYKPVGGRIKDYIALPKTNMYQSLHTTIIGPSGRIIEIQIRTEEMNQIAEYGVAAHWLYKEKAKDKKQYKCDFSWLRQIIDEKKEDAASFLHNLKIDLFRDEVFVFTPKGDAQVLPKGATPIDFAYKVHTEVGNRCVGAKVNGRIVSLNYRLRFGDRVEILTGKNANPKLGWLEIVETNHAKTKIKAWFRKQAAETNKKKGKQEVEKALVDSGYVLKEIENKLEDLLEKYGLKKIDELFLVIAHGELSPRIVIKYLDDKIGKEKPEQDKAILEQIQEVKPKKKSIKGIKVLGEENIHVNLAKCCHPLPGDDVIGYITIGYGVTVHRSDCINIQNIQEKQQVRLVEVQWEVESSKDRYPVSLQIEAFTRDGLMNDIVSKVLDYKANISGVKSIEIADGKIIIQVQIELEDINHMNQLKTILANVSDVLAVYRARGI